MFLLGVFMTALFAGYLAISYCDARGAISTQVNANIQQLVKLSEFLSKEYQKDDGHIGPQVEGSENNAAHYVFMIGSLILTLNLTLTINLTLTMHLTLILNLLHRRLGF